MRSPKLLAVAVTVILAGAAGLLAIPAVGGASGSGTSATSGNSAADASAEAAAQGKATRRKGARRRARTKNVAVRDDFFRPRRIRIRRNDSVKWTWRGRNLHNVRGRGGIRSRTQTRGTYRKKFRRRGRFSYVCTIHAGMRGVVIVR